MVKNWFKDLAASSVTDLAVFFTLFLNKWENKKNPLQILSEFDNLKRAPNDSVQLLHQVQPCSSEPEPQSLIQDSNL